MILQDTSVLITGAASGIGRETALAMAKEGAELFLSDIDTQGGNGTAEAIVAEGGRATFLPADVSRAEDVDKLMKTILSQTERLHAAVNNAGIEHGVGRMVDCEESTFDRVMAINLKGVWLCMKAELLHMVEKGKGGSIVNLASVAGIRAAPMLATYAASKYGVVGLTKSAAVEHAREGIRINAVCPSVIKTPMVERTVETNPSMLDKIIRSNPSKRMGEPSEVARTIMWLVSDQASFVTGETIAVDGGQTA